MRYSPLILPLVVCVLMSGLAGNNSLPAAAPHLLSAESDIIFGKGVHAFFDKKYKEAAAILVKAEEIQTPDPRPYYFLGLSYLRLKDSASAEAYFKKAARLEYENQTIREFEVAESLRRIQGRERERIENYRSEAKLAYQRSAVRLHEALYGKATTDKTPPSPPPVSVPAAPLPETEKTPVETGREIDADINKNVIKPEPVNPTGQPVVADSGETAAPKKTDSGVFGNLPEIPIETVIREPETKNKGEGEEGSGEGKGTAGKEPAANPFDWRGVNFSSGREEAAKQIGKEFGKTFRSLLLKQKGNSEPAETPMETPAETPVTTPVTMPVTTPSDTVPADVSSESVPESEPAPQPEPKTEPAAPEKESDQ